MRRFLLISAGVFIFLLGYGLLVHKISLKEFGPFPWKLWIIMSALVSPVYAIFFNFFILRRKSRANKNKVA